MLDSDLLKKLLDGNAPKNIRVAAAQGLVPLPPQEMLWLEIRLANDSDPEVSQKAVETLNTWSESDLVNLLQSAECKTEVLEYFARSVSPAVQEAIISNPEAAGAVIAALSLSASAPLLEAILYNRTRLLDSPEILQSIKLNPAATPQILGLVQEIETEFFGGKKREYTVGEGEADAQIQEASIDLQAEVALEDLSLEGLPLDPQEREAAILSRLAKMTVRQKIRFALLGTREMRAVLIRDTNKQVSASVLQSPKLTIAEVESFAAMRSISDDILRSIGNSKEWRKSYSVVQNLVKNPKTPLAISQRMMFRLQSRDLMLLSRDHGIPDGVRRNAQRLLSQRTAPKPAGGTH